MEVVTKNTLPAFAERVLAQLSLRAEKQSATVITLSGELGSGKTTFTQALAKAAGVAGVVQSPTYVLMKSYPIVFKNFTRLIHIDAYRFNNPEEFLALKPESFLSDKTALVVIEWPERIKGMLQKPDLSLTFSADAPFGSSAANAEERYIEGI